MKHQKYVNPTYETTFSLLKLLYLLNVIDRGDVMGTANNFYWSRMGKESRL